MEYWTEGTWSSFPRLQSYHTIFASVLRYTSCAVLHTSSFCTDRNILNQGSLLVSTSLCTLLCLQNTVHNTGCSKLFFFFKVRNGHTLVSVENQAHEFVSEFILCFVLFVKHFLLPRREFANHLKRAISSKRSCKKCSPGTFPPHLYKHRKVQLL